jgi:hypothetical protein
LEVLEEALSVSVQLGIKERAVIAGMRQPRTEHLMPFREALSIDTDKSVQRDDQWKHMDMNASFDLLMHFNSKLERAHSRHSFRDCSINTVRQARY